MTKQSILNSQRRKNGTTNSCLIKLDAPALSNERNNVQRFSTYNTPLTLSCIKKTTKLSSVTRPIRLAVAIYLITTIFISKISVGLCENDRTKSEELRNLLAEKKQLSKIEELIIEGYMKKFLEKYNNENVKQDPNNDDVDTTEGLSYGLGILNPSSYDGLQQKRAPIPFSGGIYGKRATLPFSGGIYGKRAAIPYSGGIYGKRSNTNDDGTQNKRTIIPYSGGIYGKRSPAVPFSGGIYGKRSSNNMYNNPKRNNAMPSRASMLFNGGFFGR